MTRIGVISNARSRRNRTSMRDFYALLQDHPQVKHLSFNDISDLTECLREMAAAQVTNLVISGGDGTVQATVSELINNNPFRQIPKLSLLSAGMTNVIANDVGSKGLPAVSLKRLVEKIEAGSDGECLERPVLTLDLGDDGPQIHGFVFGAIGFYQGTLLSRRDVHRLGAQQGLAAKIGILWAALRVLWHGPGPRSGFEGERVIASIDNEPAAPQDLFVILSTTLECLIPGVMPFWGDGPGRMKLTTVVNPPKRLARALLPAVRGRPRPWMHDLGYISRRAENVSLEIESPVVLDGEVFETDGGSGIRLSVGPTVAFHRY
ncbi:MAG TPA: diacylglycerol kinase family protein [Dongiaceae bacterium]|jgi:hypothetical protein